MKVSGFYTTFSNKPTRCVGVVIASSKLDSAIYLRFIQICVFTQHKKYSFGHALNKFTVNLFFRYSNKKRKLLCVVPRLSIILDRAMFFSNQKKNRFFFFYGFVNICQHTHNALFAIKIVMKAGTLFPVSSIFCSGMQYSTIPATKH